MSDPHAMQRLCGLMRKAVQDYEMISPGDKIMVGVSGGKDSVALTIGLAQLRRYLGFDYEVVAVTLDPQFDHQAVDYSPLAALFARYGVLDDAVETFYMNLWREGRIGCFSPVTQLDRRGLTLIRPMLLATEHEVRCAVKEEDFPIVKSRCPADGVTVREQTKDFVRERCRTDHAFRQKTLHALQESGIDGWRPVHTGRTSNPSPKEGMHHADAEL